MKDFLTSQFGVSLILAVVVIAAMLGAVAYCIYFERKISAWIQDRYGPNRVGPLGLLQPIADGLKFLFKEDVIPGHVDKALFILAPAIVGTAEEDTMETVFQSYSTLWAQPWRLVVYESLVVVLTAAATFIYGYAMICGYRFFNFIFGSSWLMAGKLSRIVETASSYLFGIHSPLTGFISRFFYVYTPASLGIIKPLYLSVSDIITAILVGIGLFIIAGTVIAYLLSNLSVGQALIYIILRKKKDDENLIERKDEDELEEEEEVKEDELEGEIKEENEEASEAAEEPKEE